MIIKSSLFALFCIYAVIDIANSYALSDITSDLFNGKTGDMLAAFGDFNADKLVDIFVIAKKGTNIIRNNEISSNSYEAILPAAGQITHRIK